MSEVFVLNFDRAVIDEFLDYEATQSRDGPGEYVSYCELNGGHDPHPPSAVTLMIRELVIDYQNYITRKWPSMPLGNEFMRSFFGKAHTFAMAVDADRIVDVSIQGNLLLIHAKSKEADKNTMLTLRAWNWGDDEGDPPNESR